MGGSNQAPGLDYRHVVLIALTLVPALLLFLLVDPIAQPQEYHELADARYFLGVPNFHDVASNLAFLLTGVAGVVFCLRGNIGPARNAWTVMFAGIALVSLGSAYYHWAPSDETLVWDRAAMSVGFMGLFTALLIEYISPRVGVLLMPLAVAGVGSVFYGYYFEDLRLYLCVQFVPLLMVPVVIALFTGSHSHQWLLAVGLLFYVVAKVTEFNDVNIFAATGEVVSGHTVKHLLAAVGCLCVLIMLMVRKPKTSVAEGEGSV